VNRSRDEILARLASIHARIADACSRVGRDPDDVTLVAVAKTVEPEALRWVVEAGVADLGENYVQELRAKRDAVEGARWHFIGTLRSSGAHHVAALADVVETAVPGRAFERLARRADGAGRRLPVLIEVDVTGERTGVEPRQVPEAARQVAALDGVSLAGLMTIAPPGGDAEAARPTFRRLRELRDALVGTHPEARQLSMGMSLDYEVALEEGATMVRLGTALFGARPAR
jgi:PLP dependent protein